jgi:hypothetical protein
VSTGGVEDARDAAESVAAQSGTDDAGTPTLPRLLFALLGAPVAWTLHFLLSYVLVGYGCSTGWGGLRAWLVVLTVASLAAAVAAGLLARRLWVRAREVDLPTDDRWDARMGERTARVSFLMVTGLAMAGLFSLAILYEAAPVLLVQPCSPATPS